MTPKHFAFFENQGWTRERVEKIYKHLCDTGQAFCFDSVDGTLIDRTFCENYLNTPPLHAAIEIQKED